MSYLRRFVVSIQARKTNSNATLAGSGTAVSCMT